MSLGFDRPLYILPFDHRGSFETGMFGWTGTVTPEQTSQIAEAKQVIYDGFKGAVDQGVPKEKAGILVERAIWRGDSAASQNRRLYHRLPRRKKRAGRVRL